MRALGALMPLGAIAAALLLAGCEQPETQTRMAADGTVLIPVNTGLRCHEGRCLEFDWMADQARIRPFDFVRLPDGVRLGGVMTEAQFFETYERARRAPLGGRGPSQGRS